MADTTITQTLVEIINKHFCKDVFGIVLDLLNPSAIHLICDLEMNSKDQLELLFDICRKGHLEDVKYLVSRGVDIREENDESLAIAIDNYHLDIASYLISQGAEVRDEIANSQSQSFDPYNEYLDIPHIRYLGGEDIVPNILEEKDIISNIRYLGERYTVPDIQYEGRGDITQNIPYYDRYLLDPTKNFGKISTMKYIGRNYFDN